MPSDSYDFLGGNVSFGARGLGKTERNYLGGLANRPLDFSFQTPEYLAAQERLTLNPIRATFSSARTRGLAASLRTGGPVGALYSRLAGLESEQVGAAGARNLLSNTRLAQYVAQQRFQNFFNLANAAEARFQAAQKRKAGFLGGLGQLVGMGLSFIPGYGAAKQGAA